MASQKPQVDIGQGFVNYLQERAQRRQKPAVCQERILSDPQNDTTRTRTEPYDKSNIATSHKLPLAVQNMPSRTPAHSEDMSIGFLKQPETRAISQEQLVTEVKGIYAALVMVESKCIEVDNAHCSCVTASGIGGRQ